MSTLYNQRGIWYLDATINSKRIPKSLRTKEKSTAIKLANQVENEIIKNILVGNGLVWSKNILLKSIMK